MANNNKKKVISVMISEDVYNKITEICNATHQSKSAFLRNAIHRSNAFQANGPEMVVNSIEIAELLNQNKNKMDPDLHNSMNKFTKNIIQLMNEEE